MVSSVQSPWIVCCIQRKKPRFENKILQVLYFLPKMVFHCRFIRHTLNMCLYHLSKYHFVSRCSKLWSYVQSLVNKVVCDPSNHESMMHQCTNCPGTNPLHKFLEEELSDIDPDFQFHHSQWQITDRPSLVTHIINLWI